MKTESDFKITLDSAAALFGADRAMEEFCKVLGYSAGKKVFPNLVTAAYGTRNFVGGREVAVEVTERLSSFSVERDAAGPRIEAVYSYADRCDLPGGERVVREREKRVVFTGKDAARDFARDLLLRSEFNPEVLGKAAETLRRARKNGRALS